MRTLREQLIEALDVARKQQHLPRPEARIGAVLVHDFLSLLLATGRARTGMRWRMVSHEHLHRHVFTIRCPDQAFYLDAIKSYFVRHNIQPLEQQAMTVRLTHDDQSYPRLRPASASHAGEPAMLIALHVSATLVPDGRRVARHLAAILRAVGLTVRDFSAMRASLTDAATRLEQDSPRATELLRWMNADRYIFLGMQAGKKRLGIFANQQICERIVQGMAPEITALPPPVRPGVEWIHLRAGQHHLYIITSLDVVRICWREKNALNHLILLGYFSRSARHANASRTPLLRQCWQELLASPPLAQSAFYRREIRTIFDRLPKPLLLSSPAATLLPPLKAIADLTGPTQTHTTVFAPRPGNVNLLLAALPADRFGPNVLRDLFERLRSIDITPHAHHAFGIGAHRLLLIMFTCANEPDTAAIAHAVQMAVIFWKDLARAHVLQHARSLDIPGMLAKLEQVPLLYQDLFPPEQFIGDMQALDRVRSHDRARVHVRKSNGGINIQVFTRRPQPLGELVSTVAAFGLNAMKEAVVEFTESDTTLYLSSLYCACPFPLLPDDFDRLTLALSRVLNDEADNEAINALVLSAGLDIQQVAVIAALRSHLVQLLPGAAPLLLNAMLNRYPRVTAHLYRMFEAQHRPAMPETYQAQAGKAFDKAMETVQSLTDDRWFRALAELVKAGMRTNAYVRNPATPVAVKIDPSRLSFAPRPVPYREIFVHGVHVEGVHLRAGPIARGGLRFSDRPADFRTEVLELMATQTVKNGQIVPTGAKGGFVLRNIAGERPSETFIRRQYRTFVTTLLALTDNLAQGKLKPPAGIRIYPDDENDPYLVVAADKGTARYSDLANEAADKAGFWLGDAFASGGRYGYDHKAVGITARGAWVCAVQHFTSLGIDAWHDPIRIIGIGDMGGDVFGNGMLINPDIRLVAAFNHKHIFLDPEPDPKRAFTERKRLFAQVLGWDAYDPDAIGPGGGVYARTAKNIPISPEAAKALDIDETALSGEALIRVLLTAPVDMLYNGGIGTYVKASDETHAEVFDPSNNAVRVNAGQLRCTVVCEGGNLGFTQKARLEYAAAGGRINTDAIDNSAGVDMSDHEVNLKVLFSAMPQPPSLTRRNRMLRALTKAVTGQCLSDNLQQSRALTLAAMEANEFLPRVCRLRDLLLTEGRIDRRVDPAMHEAESDSLHLRPQLAVLLGHEKNRLHERLADCCFEHDACFRDTLLLAYFPAPVRRRFITAIQAHPLAADITHTMAANHIVNDFGLGAVHHLETLLDHSTGKIVLGLLMAEYLLDADGLRRAIWREVVDPGAAFAMQRALQEHLMRFAEEFLRLCPVTGLSHAWLARQRAGIRRFRHLLHKQEGTHQSDAVHTAVQAGLAPERAAHLAAMPELEQSATALHLSARLKLPIQRCLKANRACLHLLPLRAAEAPLRTAAWGDAAAHALRCEWLQRLTALKSRAVHQLLESRQRNLLRAGETRWGSHRHWRSIGQLQTELAGNKVDRMRLLLLLTRLESLIDDCGRHTP